MGTGRLLVTGGARSGKSAYAIARALALPPPRVYVATATAGDAEMTKRIAAHRRERGADFTTVEEPLAVVGALGRVDRADGVVLLDCLTLWISNLVESRDDAAIERDVATLASAIEAAAGTVIVVTNEVGAGIVPFDPPVRRYRDLLGLANQRIAAVADEVVLMVAGVPVVAKAPR